VADSSENGNEPSGSIKGWKFPDQLNDYQFLKKDSASWSWLVRSVRSKKLFFHGNVNQMRTNWIKTFRGSLLHMLGASLLVHT
jgi:hypothetical protein